MGGGGKGEFFDLDERRGGGDLMVDHDIVREVRRGDTPRRRNRTVEANGGIKKPVRRRSYEWVEGGPVEDWWKIAGHGQQLDLNPVVKNLSY
ncbi:hypothetical protein OsI_38121 [Oryza sativa Indica Group]|uniref:Uncharacterized protein n=1 Tax=Oryza sativa subsp. indica TaxID=39946 RepID=A2ZJX4_ORYSI|nr:hypothetical protein OsI_38121 [Oryza sativa Indica Group]